MALRLSPGHSHSESSNPLNSVCWVWWDVLPIHGLAGEYEDGAELDAAIIAVLWRILQIDSIACQESALYGLAEWRSHYEEEASAIIGNFLIRNPSFLGHILPALAAYIVG